VVWFATIVHKKSGDKSHVWVCTSQLRQPQAWKKLRQRNKSLVRLDASAVFDVQAMHLSSAPDHHFNPLP
jgi:hypothetical protein